MEGNLEISLDNLPIKRVAAIEESGFERFPLDIGYDQKRTDLIRRIDFAWVVEKDTKKQKTSKEAVKPRPWKSLMENLQLAYQEVSVITDLIHTVEVNDAVTVAGMTRPKQFPNEVLVSDPTTIFRLRFISIVRIDRDSAGMLVVQMPSKSSQSIHFGFLGAPSVCKSRSQMKYSTNEQSIIETKKKSGREDEVDKCTHEAHSTLREVHQAIFDEQVFNLVNCEAFKPSPGVDVTGIRENYLQIRIVIRLDTLEGVVVAEEAASSLEKLPGNPNSLSCEIYLQQIFHGNVFARAKCRDPSTAKTQISGQSTGDGFDLLGHFCEGAPNVSGLFKGNYEDFCSMNNYDSNLADVPVILLQQIASQVVRWLHEEALVVGMKASRDFLSLPFELEQEGRLCLVAHVDPNDANGCISWWLVMVDGLMEEGKFNTDFSKGESENVRFLGNLALGTLYSTLMDLVCLCNSSGSF
ncbi:hypothetical protein GIB67_017941 [Kingdonia uniflora]|uniref:Mediator of RNA polymerase II transcription subunit 17 n=1 Tax=Kingdonia uniflora TaxID=39325 RepID=A0A7J7MI08_9MAGN|nr:hypothetical protein GIB67_017941 [Kingdonia uniflora]